MPCTCTEYICMIYMLGSGIQPRLMTFSLSRFASKKEKKIMWAQYQDLRPSWIWANRPYTKSTNSFLNWYNQSSSYIRGGLVPWQRLDHTPTISPFRGRGLIPRRLGRVSSETPEPFTTATCRNNAPPSLCWTFLRLCYSLLKWFTSNPTGFLVFCCFGWILCFSCHLSFWICYF